MEEIFDKKKSIEFLAKMFTMAGIDFRRKEPNEEGGFFYKENGIRKKFEGNIFVKRSLQFEQGIIETNIISINDILAEGNEYEPDIDDSICANLTPTESVEPTHNENISVQSATELSHNHINDLKSFDSSFPLFLDAA